MQHLADDDYITSTTGTWALIAKGGDFSKMFAELFGKARVIVKGRAAVCIFPIWPLECLARMALSEAVHPSLWARPSQSVSENKANISRVFGDGASNEGGFHEAANMAALYKLPCLFVCENNGYGEYTSQANHQAIVDVADRAAGYGMPGVVVDGMDLVAVYEAAGEAIDRARKGEGQHY